jgi:prophage DNA circulation protein
MADENRIINGFYKGIAIAIDSASVDGGRKTAIKQFPSRDTQSVEDLGLRPRKYSLEIVINDKQDQDYFAYRNSLLAALESKGPGELIHPLYGRIENVVAVSYSLNEVFNSFGDTTVSVDFEVNENTGIPVSSANVVTEISISNDAVQEAVALDISEDFVVTESFSGNFSAAVDKVNEIIDQAREATSFVGEAAEKLNEFSAEIGQLSANVNALVSNPLQLSQAFTSLFNSVNGLYASSRATFETFVGFFGFGNADTDILQNTAGRIQRKKNNDVLNGAVAASSLGYSYLASVKIDYQTTREIDELTARLDAQYEQVQQSGASQEVKDAITDMRVIVLQSLDQVRVNTPRIITIDTNPTTIRILGFNYYGNDEQGQVLSELNDISDVSFIQGEIQVLTA